MSLLVQNLFTGLTYGMILFLIAAGLSIVIGIMGITNLAHGALYMIGAYVGWTVAVKYHLNYLVAALAGGLAAAVIGLFIQVVFLNRLYKQPNEQVLLTFGFIFILATSTRAVWGATFKMQYTHPALFKTVEIGGIPFSLGRIAILVVGFVIAALLWYVQDRTRMGAIVRAGMDDKEMIMGLGVNLPLVSLVVFFMASFIAGLGGVLGSQLVGPNLGMGTDILLLALVVTIVGGVGSVQGALLGGLLIGVIDTLGKVYIHQIGSFTIYLAMVIILLVRPRGLLGREVG